MKIIIPAVKPRNPFYKDLQILKPRVVAPKKGKLSYKRVKKVEIDDVR